jgi:hypothetical protein
VRYHKRWLFWRSNQEDTDKVAVELPIEGAQDRSAEGSEVMIEVVGDKPGILCGAGWYGRTA